VDLLGFRVVWDDGTKCQVDIGPEDSPNSMYLTTGNPANVGRLAHYAFGLPTYWAQRDELGAELVRRGFEGVRPDGQAGWFVNSPSGYVQHFCVVKHPAMFPGAATPCAEYPSAACTAAYQKGLENLDSIPGPSGTGFTALYFKYIILHVPDVAKESDFYKSLMGMGVLDESTRFETWLRFGQNTLVLRPAEAQSVPFSLPYINEFGFVIENYDQEKVKAELDRRGIPSNLNAFGGYDFLDPNGLKISINGSGGILYRVR
jgi:catechol 2,3-dioxygenase-like lactoylglutathione lyase family enzyme